MKNSYNLIFYIGFVCFGLYEAIFKKDYMQAASFLGIALVFDPFNVDQKWLDRPIWQKAILIIHLGIVAALFGFSVGSNDK
jgi:hypothetical protein